MLSGCYSRRITSPEQLIPHLRFKHWRSDTPLEVANTEELLPVVQKAVEQYLRGTGHPFHDSEICKNLADPLTFDEENTDPSLRSRRFVKALSGLEMMPVDNHKFTVSVNLSAQIDLLIVISNTRFPFMKISKIPLFSWDLVDPNIMYVR